MAWYLDILSLEMGRFCVTFCLMMATTVTETSADQMSSLQSGSPSSEGGWNSTLLVALPAVAFLSILVYALLNCNDCYKSEVSTEFHPATSGSGVKWGGAGGYAPGENCDVNRSVLGAGFSSGETVTPADPGSHQLPYTMIPAQVPEAQGFRGYAAVEPAGAPPPGLRGYGAMEGGSSLAGYGSAGMQWGGGGGGATGGQGGGGGGGGQWGGGGGGQWGGGHTGSQYMPGAHVSPAMTQGQEDPPPPYFAPSYS